MNIENRKENARKKGIVVQRREGGVKGNHTDGIDTRRGEQTKSVGDERQLGSSRHYGIGIGIEGYRDSSDSALMCIGNHLINKMPMPTMHAVKRTDSDRACAARKSGGVLEGIDRCRSFTEHEVAP